jgi:hypothetical protein
LNCYGISDGGAYPVGEHTLPGCIQPGTIVGDGETTFTITSYGTPCTTTTSTSTSTTSTTTFSPDPCICTEVVITSAGGEVETFNCFGVNENYVYMNAGTYHICAASIGGLLQAFFAEGTTGTISPVGNCKTQTCPPPTTTSTSTTSTSTTSTSTTTIAPFTACMSDFSSDSACSCDGLSYGTWTFYGSGNSICTSTTITSTGILSEIENNGFFWVASGGQVRYYQKNGTTSSATAQAACFVCPTTTTTTTTTLPPVSFSTSAGCANGVASDGVGAMVGFNGGSGEYQASDFTHPTQGSALNGSFSDTNVSISRTFSGLSAGTYWVALRDKNNEDNAKEKFQRINEAYDYLSNELRLINGQENSNTSEPFVSSSTSEDPKIYMNILSTFVSSLFSEAKKGTYNDIFMSIIKEIVTGYNALTLTYLRKIFEGVDKIKAIELYQFLYKYKDILYISNDTLEFVSLIAKEKSQKGKENDRVFILKPLMKDLLENNIYKLYVDEELYLVPLWHNELYFDAKDGSEIIVLCQPKLSDELTIDENNNIYCEKQIKLDAELLYLIKKEKFVSIEIGGKWFSIPLSKLYLKEEQLYKFKGQGISRISEKDIYNVSCRSDIIVKIILV